MIHLAREFFRRADAGSPDLFEILSEDVDIYFPKFGVGRGKDAVAELAGGLGKLMIQAIHDTADYLFIPHGNRLAVEGTTTGTKLNGEPWAAGQTPTGRFCDIFEFRDGLISRVYVYLDPDYGGDDEARFAWGKDRAW